MRTSIPAVIAILFCVAGRVEAQNPPPRIALGFGVGSMASVASDSNGSVPFFAGSMRVDFRRHMAVEIEGAYWSDEHHYQYGPGQITVVGADNKSTYVPYALATFDGSDSWWEATVNLLARSTGRVSIYGGGGFGFGEVKSTDVTVYTGCASAATCRTSTWSRNEGGLTLGSVAGVDAMITERIIGFGSVRATVGYTGRGADVGALAGVKVRVR